MEKAPGEMPRPFVIAWLVSSRSKNHAVDEASPPPPQPCNIPEYDLASRNLRVGESHLYAGIYTYI